MGRDPLVRPDAVTGEAAPGFVGRFAPDDPERRRDFDRRLARYLRRFHDHWDVAAIFDMLPELQGHVDEALLDLARRPDGSLAVTVSFTLAPHPCDLAG